MKITKIELFEAIMSFTTTKFTEKRWGKPAFPDTIVAIHTDEEIVGWGESCPLGPTYLRATSGGLRAVLAILAPKLIGQDPRELGVIDHIMDTAMLGHLSAKAAIDMACWDILGKTSNLPLKTLLGGAKVNKVPVYKVIGTDEPSAMVAEYEQARSEGFFQFQVKLGIGGSADIERMRAIGSIMRPNERVIFDANRGWSMAEARRVAIAANQLDPALDFFFEQPCLTYEESLTIRRLCQRPFVMDEVIDDLNDLVRAINDEALDAVAIKLSHAGGLTKAREMIAVALRAGVMVRIEDTIGADFVRTAVAHLASTIPPKMLLTSYPHPSEVVIGHTETRLENGFMNAGDRPGHGVRPNFEELGEPIAVY